MPLLKQTAKLALLIALSIAGLSLIECLVFVRTLPDMRVECPA